MLPLETSNTWADNTINSSNNGSGKTTTLMATLITLHSNTVGTRLEWLWFSLVTNSSFIPGHQHLDIRTCHIPFAHCCDNNSNKPKRKKATCPSSKKTLTLICSVVWRNFFRQFLRFVIFLLFLLKKTEKISIFTFCLEFLRCFFGISYFYETFAVLFLSMWLTLVVENFFFEISPFLCA